MVTVYIWNAHYVKASVGHASMAVSGGRPTGNIYISWWPLRRSLNALAVGVPRVVHASLHDDESGKGEGRKPDHTINLQGLNETAIKAFWQRWSKSGNYSGLLFSCATTVGQALKEGGGDQYARGWRSPTVWTPADVLRYAQAIQGGFATRRSPSQLRLGAR